MLLRHVKTATKLAPSKTVSVCVLELNAGLIWAPVPRLAKFVQTMSVKTKKEILKDKMEIPKGSFWCNAQVK